MSPNTLPSGSTVQAGSVAITQPSANKLQVTQGSDKAIIDWRSYSIGSQAWVNYTMPGAGSVSLNRVTGGDPSQILGKLTANGTVMLINPNGIVFGKGSVVDVAGLVATTANIRNQDFMAGRYNFTLPGNPGATILNEGTITVKQAGIAAFVAPGVENRGTIVADLGTVSLGAGNTFTLDLYGDGLVRLAVTDPVTVAALGEGQALVKNSGLIRANGGKVLITAAAAKGVVDTVINMDGMVVSKSVHQSADGSVVFDGGQHGTVNMAGTVDVSAATPGLGAGKVTITGEKVRIAGTARI
ncbi:MAG: filamentous hemagglutinin N-terminal domain-containing protein, partial [Alphaproteobacteria bacterium]